MDKEFVTYEQALALKELGFKEDCLASYYHAGKRLDICEYINHGEYTMLAPLKQQVFRWFREKYDISVYITRNLHFVDNNTKWKPVIANMYYPQLTFDTYEEAENAAIDKLIEIAKQQDNG
jgi:hypothetical protein